MSSLTRCSSDRTYHCLATGSYMAGSIDSHSLFDVLAQSALSSGQRGGTSPVGIRGGGAVTEEE